MTSAPRSASSPPSSAGPSIELSMTRTPASSVSWSGTERTYSGFRSAEAVHGHGGPGRARIDPVTPAHARRLWRLLEPYHAVTYFAPVAHQAFKDAGLRGFWMGYFAGRAA